MSGRQFFTVEEMLYSAHHATYEESLEAGTHCFLMAIDVRAWKEGEQGPLLVLVRVYVKNPLVIV